MRGRFIFVVLGLAFVVISGCVASKGTLVVKNSARRDLSLTLQGSSKGTEKYNESLDVKNEETIRKEIQIEVPLPTLFTSPKGMSILIKTDNDTVIGGATIIENKEASVEIVSNKKPCPDPQLAGIWEIITAFEGSKGKTITFFSNCNKGTATLEPFSGTTIETGYFMWKVENGRLYYKEYYDLRLKTEEEMNWIEKEYSVVDDQLTLGGTKFLKVGDSND